ncbi:hypothetical protein H7K33_15615 [Mycobacterium paraense]|uniref:Uncharacterized protein n=1 Tax=Mycobacterium paraense TaxID=767916 RepID=A0A1X2A496_9MYCO|nr:DUF6611 family protein [Mycobacterium paraense]MCV7443665.1 hypothetical protein [Mycobacterium paraense]ORW38242.1 hypothetical protein AWB90_23390 [Mycobacterium paraense]ORW47429.1 hypothetical protein AWB89_09865 [Mycobacterium paraense]
MRKAEQRHAESSIRQPTESAPARPQWWSRLLDGPHQWGSFDATVGRYGAQRDRLILYPPGSTAADRRMARLWRGWPTTGAALGLLAIMLLGHAGVSPDEVLAVFVVAYVGIGALLFLRAGPLRVPVRSMLVILLPNTADARGRRSHTECRALADMLVRADDLLASGAISVVEREAIWWEAYDRLEAARR